ncbi:MAG: lamin tail domain-containing protein, partial [Acidobacteriales bacterium]|nr:lamin tail domain-containing protein [Terriglobales bacterium]
MCRHLLVHPEAPNIQSLLPTDASSLLRRVAGQLHHSVCATDQNRGHTEAVSFLRGWQAGNLCNCCPNTAYWITIQHMMSAPICLRLFVVAIVSFTTFAHAAVRISEFMAENDGGLRDPDGDTPDWIEIQNDSSSAVNLGGWHLTDSETNLTKWTFPALTLPAHGFLVVFASGKDRATNTADL